MCFELLDKGKNKNIIERKMKNSMLDLDQTIVATLRIMVIFFFG